MSVLAFAISFTFYLGTPHYTLDISPVFMLEVGNIPHPFLNDKHITGLAFPHLIILNGDRRTTTTDSRKNAIKHERVHIRQYEALGPAFSLAYLLTFGVPFEDYKNPEGVMWTPPEDMKHCPMLRFTDLSVSFLPCWSVWR